MLLYYSPQCLEHETGAHPEQPERLRRTWALLEAMGWPERCVRPDWKPATPSQLAGSHDAAYLGQLERFCDAGGGRLEVDTVVSTRSFAAASTAAGAARDAVTRVLAGEATTAACLMRPPGHHALPGGAMGFCLLNNVAVAARCAVDELGLDRVLIVDWDVHHGNGTQDAFWEDPRVAFFSLHRWPFYPGTGSAEETGAGPGLGTTCNVPITFGSRRETILERFRSEIEAFARRIRPQLILLSAGFDAHREDPVGSLGLETEDFAALTAATAEVAAEHSAGRLVSLLEGGYHVDRLAESYVAHLEAIVATT